MFDHQKNLDHIFSKLTTFWLALESRQKLWMKVINTGLLLVVFVALNKILMGPLTGLNAPSYNQQHMIMVFINAVLSNPRLLVVILVAMVFITLRWSSICSTWKNLGLPRAVRIYTVFIAAIMSWASASYDYNLYLDTYHHMDRILLLVAIPAIYWRPGFLLPYLCILCVYLGQYSLGIGGYSWAEFSMLIGLLSLSVAVLILRACLQRDWSVEYLLIAVCFIASHYWIAGWGKYQLDWHQVNEVYRLLSNTYANGWLGWLDQQEISAVIRWTIPLNTPILIGTLILEWGVLLVLWRKASLQLFIVCWIVFHFSIFASSGIFFWKWISIEIALLLLLQNLPQKLTLELFTPARFALSTLLIATSLYWSQATKLAWLDMPMTYTYKFTAETENGEHFNLPPAFFGPYDYQFTLGKFDYLSKHRNIRIAWGATSNKRLLQLANQARTPEDVLKFEKEHGALTYDQDRTKALARFLRKFSDSYNRKGSKPGFYSLIKAPRQLWTYPGQSLMPSGSVIKNIQIDQVLTFFDGHEYMEIISRPVYQVSIGKLSG